MRTIYRLLPIIFSILFFSCKDETNDQTQVRRPINYTILIDLSDRILTENQLDKDIYLIESAFQIFKNKALKNLIITSKDRFSVKIIPQKNSKVSKDKYEDLLHIYLDELNVQDKNSTLISFSNSLNKTLNNLKEEALYSHNRKDYFGVDIWAYLHDKGLKLSLDNYDNTIFILTDGYFDFEDQSHVIYEKNQFTSTIFLSKLNQSNWKIQFERCGFGLIPIKLDKNTKWIISGISGKNPKDILQTEKITFIWDNWLKKSGVNIRHFILNDSKSNMNSSLLKILE